MRDCVPGEIHSPQSARSILYGRSSMGKNNLLYRDKIRRGHHALFAGGNYGIPAVFCWWKKSEGSVERIDLSRQRVKFKERNTSSAKLSHCNLTKEMDDVRVFLCQKLGSQIWFINWLKTLILRSLRILFLFYIIFDNKRLFSCFLIFSSFKR